MVYFPDHPLDFSVAVIFPGHQENARGRQVQEIIESTICLEKIFADEPLRIHSVIAIQASIPILGRPEIPHIKERTT